MPRRRAGRSDRRLWDLTPRELLVLRLLSEGRSNQNIADAIDVTLKSVLGNIRSIFSKKDLPPYDRQRHRRVSVARMQWQDDQTEHYLDVVDARLEMLIRDLLLVRRRLSASRSRASTPPGSAGTDAPNPNTT